MKVIGCVGTGAFGKVMKIKVDSRILAMKKISLGLDQSEWMEKLAELEKEAALMEGCAFHPNVVTCYYSFRKDNDFHIMMEYAGHRTLYDVELPLINDKQIVNLIIQLCLGLKHLKSRKIVHRDIKPKNIIVSQKGLLKIADFGISRIIEYENQAKTYLGTPYYTAPEIFNSMNYGFAVDIWSFGVVLYEMTHGNLPFLAKGLQELKEKIKFQIPSLKRQLHSDIRLIIRRCLTKKPENRITVQEILDIPLVREQMKRQHNQAFRYF